MAVWQDMGFMNTPVSYRDNIDTKAIMSQYMVQISESPNVLDSETWASIH